MTVTERRLALTIVPQFADHTHSREIVDDPQTGYAWHCAWCGETVREDLDVTCEGWCGAPTKGCTIC